jgi:hypothetical protein
MLFHLQQEIDQFLALGGEEVEGTVRTLRTLSFAERNNGEIVRSDAAKSLNRRTTDAQGGDGAGG